MPCGGATCWSLPVVVVSYVVCCAVRWCHLLEFTICHGLVLCHAVKLCHLLEFTCCCGLLCVALCRTVVPSVVVYMSLWSPMWCVVPYVVPPVVVYMLLWSPMWCVVPYGGATCCSLHVVVVSYVVCCAVRWCHLLDVTCDCVLLWWCVVPFGGATCWSLPVIVVSF